MAVEEEETMVAIVMTTIVMMGKLILGMTIEKMILIRSHIMNLRKISSKKK